KKKKKKKKSRRNKYYTTSQNGHTQQVECTFTVVSISPSTTLYLERLIKFKVELSPNLRLFPFFLFLRLSHR
ncbi:hypothetical protein, partial [Escherichia coli]|uniref:hypothetical protein n=1 Tax=Escherichia coli TaxID=562 RepID=UPI001BAE65D7